MTENNSPAQTPEARTSRRRMPWWAWAGIGAVAIATAIAIPVTLSASAHTAALDTYRQSASTATATSAAATNAAADLAAKSAAAVSEADALQAVVDQTPADLVADPGARDAATAAITQLRTSAAIPAIKVPAPSEWNDLDESASTDNLTTAASSAASYTSTTARMASDASAAQAKISDDLATVETQIDKLVASAAAKAGTLVYDRAGDGEKQALTAAVAALQARKSGTGRPSTEDTAALVGAYVAAANAAKASHDAAIAADQNNTNGGDTGGSSDGEGSWGGSSGGGSGGGGWGGSSGGGSGGGGWGGTGGGSGGGSGGSPSYPRGSVIHSGSACSGSGGSASANWASNLMPPADSTVTNVWENQAGDEWGISWQCNAIDF